MAPYNICKAESDMGACLLCLSILMRSCVVEYITQAKDYSACKQHNSDYKFMDMDACIRRLYSNVCKGVGGTSLTELH